MCKFCVEDGIMTQDELDSALAAGDRSVVPLLELSEEEFEQEITTLARQRIQAGDDPVVVFVETVRVISGRRHVIASMN